MCQGGLYVSFLIFLSHCEGEMISCFIEKETADQRSNLPRITQQSQVCLTSVPMTLLEHTYK